MDNEKQFASLTILALVGIIVAMKQAGASDDILIGTLNAIKIEPRVIAHFFDIDRISRVIELAGENSKITFVTTPELVADLDYLHHIFSSDLPH